MLTYSLKCRKIQKAKTRGFQRQIKENEFFYQNVQVCDSKKLRFIKEQEAVGLLSMIGKILILDS